MLCRKPSILLFQKKNKSDTVNKTDKSQSCNKTVDTPKIIKTDTVKSLDKSRSTQRTDTENIVDKSRYIPRRNYSNKSTIIEKPSEIHIHKDSLNVSGWSVRGESLSCETLDTLCIYRKNKGKKTPDTSIIRKDPIQEPVNKRKSVKENTLTDLDKSSPSFNDLFKRKQIIEDLEAELTGSLTKTG